MSITRDILIFPYYGVIRELSWDDYICKTLFFVCDFSMHKEIVAALCILLLKLPMIDDNSWYDKKWKLKNGKSLIK